ncbi:MAG: hypothetical protein NTW28_16315, partial [Candidatus Solibacter sp.]|nr:hypothetical protein [Candidatus Solibacter sp.]
DEAKFCDCRGSPTAVAPVPERVLSFRRTVVQKHHHSWLPLAGMAVAAAGITIVFSPALRELLTREGRSRGNISGLLSSAALSRSEAKMRLEKLPMLPAANVHINLNDPYLQSDGYMGAPLVQLGYIPLLQELIRTGFVVQEQGQMWDGTVALIGGEKRYAPSYTNRLTEKGRKTMPGGSIIVQFTRNIEVTGVLAEGRRATVTYSTTVGVVPFAGEIQLTKVAAAAGSQVSYDILGIPQQGQALFMKYDDGWRMTQINDMPVDIR